MTTSLVIDTDTASDDAVALLMAQRTPGVEIRAITTVAGNVPVEQATRNALVTLDFVGETDVPVYQGMGKPLHRPLETAQFVHGDDGMSGVSFPAPSLRQADEDAVDILRDIAANEPGEHTLVTLGPLTNIATAILHDPSFLERFDRVVTMGGAFDNVGNVHRVGEFNLWADPEAAKIFVDAAGMATFVGWDISRRQAVFNESEQTELRQLGRLGEFVVDINRCVDEFARNESGIAGYDLPDPIAMSVAIDPSIAKATRTVHVDIGLDEAGRGGTFIDYRRTAPSPNCRIVLDADEAGFKRMLAEACTEPLSA